MNTKKLNFYEWLMEEYPDPKFKGGEYPKLPISVVKEDFAYVIKNDVNFPKDAMEKTEIWDYFMDKEANDPDYYNGYSTLCIFNDFWGDYSSPENTSSEKHLDSSSLNEIEPDAENCCEFYENLGFEDLYINFQPTKITITGNEIAIERMAQSLNSLVYDPQENLFIDED